MNGDIRFSTFGNTIVEKMFLSGFSFVRNATKLYYPVKESIESILPIVDEFIVALGKGDRDDYTLKEIEKIQSDKIKILHTEWNLEEFPGGAEYAHQTDIAKSACNGKWLFYLQSDEVVHEKYLPIIKQRCEALTDNREVEGLLFSYLHFWGDYKHHVVSHKWYPREIRIIRNDKDIHSWRDAQSFRRIADFDGRNYFQKEGTKKLKVAKVDAAIYHYGWVRPPGVMQEKRQSFESHMSGSDIANTRFRVAPPSFNYGDLDRLRTFHDTHPQVMKDFIGKFNWQQELDKGKNNPLKQKHDKLKYRLLTFFEQRLIGGRQIGGFKNYELLNV